MKNIIAPPTKIIQLISNDQNSINLKAWIDILKKPLENKLFVPNCFRLSSVLHKGTEENLFNSTTDLVRLDFPTTISGLYQELEQDENNQGYLTLSVNNLGNIFFVTKQHSVARYEELLEKKKNLIKGNYSQIVKFYLEYLNELISIPKPENL